MAATEKLTILHKKRLVKKKATNLTYFVHTSVSFGQAGDEEADDDEAEHQQGGHDQAQQRHVSSTVAHVGGRRSGHGCRGRQVSHKAGRRLGWGWGWGRCGAGGWGSRSFFVFVTKQNANWMMGHIFQFSHNALRVPIRALWWELNLAKSLASCQQPWLNGIPADFLVLNPFVLGSLLLSRLCSQHLHCVSAAFPRAFPSTLQLLNGQQAALSPGMT